MLKKLYHIFEHPTNSNASLLFHIFIFAIILINVGALFLDTVQEYSLAYGNYFTLIEDVTIAIFTVEYILRVTAAGGVSKYRGVRGRIRYMFTPMALIDLAAILPYYFLLFGADYSFLRVLRLLRVLKLFRAIEHFKFFSVLVRVMHSVKHDLLLISIVIMVFLMMISAFIYYVEYPAQPEVFSSIPQTLWWAIVTLSTVGYGDMYPITILGKMLASGVILLGIAFVAIPGGIITASIIEEIHEIRASKEREREKKKKEEDDFN